MLAIVVYLARHSGVVAVHMSTVAARPSTSLSLRSVAPQSHFAPPVFCWYERLIATFIWVRDDVKVEQSETKHDFPLRRGRARSKHISADTKWEKCAAGLFDATLSWRCPHCDRCAGATKLMGDSGQTIITTWVENALLEFMNTDEWCVTAGCPHVFQRVWSCNVFAQ